jgi:histidinol dehydrogenase
MRCEQLALRREPTALAAELRALIPAQESVRGAVGEIIARVKAEGDAAVLEYTRTLDLEGADPMPVRVGDAELEEASAQVAPPVLKGLEQAVTSVRRVAEAALGTERTVDFEAHRVTLREAPVERAGIYVPGGRAPYPSTVVMGVVAARVAGVAEVAVCAPPTADGELDPVILGACWLTGATAVYRMGGAQAVAALAYGTDSVSAVDVIAGPGNLYVQEAKRQVFGDVGIDGFAGPSDLVVIADPGEDAETLALDLLAQAEHGPGTLVIGISRSQELLGDLKAKIEAADDTGAIACLVRVDDAEQGLALAEALAPEHLQLVGPEAEGMVDRVTRAGCLFVGAAAGTAFGDYIAGSNHILPTGGAARFASGLSPATFRRRFTEVRIDDPVELASAAAPVARAEGFELHARSMEARIRDNGP